MRTIDADAALKALRKCQTYLYDARDPELKIELSSAEAAINNLPTVQPEPTDEQVAEYCKRRCLHVVTDDFFHTVQPEPHEGEWVQIQRCTGDAQPDLECPFCKHRIGWFDMGRYCAGCGAKLKGGTG